MIERATAPGHHAGPVWFEPIQRSPNLGRVVLWPRACSETRDGSRPSRKAGVASDHVDRTRRAFEDANTGGSLEDRGGPHSADVFAAARDSDACLAGASTSVNELAAARLAAAGEPLSYTPWHPPPTERSWSPSVPAEWSRGVVIDVILQRATAVPDRGVERTDTRAELTPGAVNGASPSDVVESGLGTVCAGEQEIVDQVQRMVALAV